MKKKILISATAVIAGLLMVFFIFGSFKEVRADATPSGSISYYDSNYKEYLDRYGFLGILSDKEVVVDMESYSVSGGLSAYIGEEGIITDDIGAITWEFNAPEEGFYNLLIGYIALPGTTSDIQRKIYINDELYHDGLSQIVLKRFWIDDTIINKNGNEIRPNISEIYKNTVLYIEDYQRRVGEPYIFYLKKGINTITFEAIKEPVEYTSIIFKKAKAAADYNDIADSLVNEHSMYNNEPLVYQAERADGETTISIIKSSSSINIQKNYSSSFVIPYHPYRIVYNTIGGDNWKQPGNSITWVIEVPEDGLYQIAFKGRQSLKRGVTAYRRLSINDEVPYQQMNSIGFKYQGSISSYVIADNDGEPYMFYLQKGVNTIALECVMGSLGSVISEVEESMYALNQVFLQVVQITGLAPDRFIDYEIAKKIPDFSRIMQEESIKLIEIVDRLMEITGEKGENTTLIEKMAIQAKGLAKDPEGVSDEIIQFKNNISALGTWLVTVSEMPLELDSIVISSPVEEVELLSVPIYKKAYYSTVRFLSTFFVKIGEPASAKANETKSIKVWMATSAGVAGQSTNGREQAQIIQNMADEIFTPVSGISVDLQLIPVDVVLRAALAGNSPDAVIGLNQATLQDFAMRNAIADLSSMNDFYEETERFYQSTIDAASYQGKVYGMPEQAMFMMLFVRNDIFDKIGAKIPKTWEDIMDILPVLQKYNYTIYIPATNSGPNLITSIIFQYGGNLFKGTGNDYGIKSALDEEKAVLAFKEYTDLFTSYGLETTVDFPNRFRTGEMPLGIANYNTYNQLEIFAPEIKGQWTFYLLPGTEKEDGSIDNTYVVETVQSAILNSSDNKDEAWEFIKWWSGTDAQLTYANTVESVMGTSARYPAADPNVMKQLPWSNKELTMLLEQFEASIGIPAVPGSYMSARMVKYSFDNVVAEMANPREILYLNIKPINKELTKKREEFSLSVSP